VRALLARWRAHRSPFDARGKWKVQSTNGAKVVNADGRWFAQVDDTLTGPLATYGDALDVVTERYDVWREVEIVGGKERPARG
jgi:hypothetical protein